MLGYTCPETLWSCYNWTSAGGGSKCLKQSYRCNGEADCKNGEDELDCTSKITI